MKQVHTSLLICAECSHSGLLRTYGPLASEELPQYFVLLDDVIERWYDVVGRFAPPGRVDYRGYCELLTLLQRGFETLLEEDDPVVAFAERKKLRGLLAKFDDVAAEMAVPFSQPRSIREFYTNLSERLNHTYHYIVEGDD